MSKLDQENFPRGIYPSLKPPDQEIKPKGEYLDFEWAQPSKGEETFRRMESLFNSVSKKGKIMGRLERNELREDSVILQQDIIEHLLIFGKDGKDRQKGEEFWEEYNRRVDKYIEKLRPDAETEKRIRDEFNFLKIASLGSAAVARFFKGQGLEMIYPDIKEDEFKKCDLIFKTTDFVLAVQIKSNCLSDIDSGQLHEVVEGLIVTNENKLDEDNKKTFRILKEYSSELSKKLGVPCFPLFINMPISKKEWNKYRRRMEIVELVDAAGNINPTMQNTLEVKWRESKKKIGIDEIN